MHWRAHQLNWRARVDRYWADCCVAHHWHCVTLIIVIRLSDRFLKLLAEELISRSLLSVVMHWIARNENQVNKTFVFLSFELNVEWEESEKASEKWKVTESARYLVIADSRKGLLCLGATHPPLGRLWTPWTTWTPTPLFLSVLGLWICSKRFTHCIRHFSNFPNIFYNY